MSSNNGKRKPVPQGVRFNVFRRDKFTCRYCGRSSPEVELHCDHVQPIAKGGSDLEDNLITACVDCNYGKGTKSVDVQPAISGLVGLFGHLLEKGKIEKQFKIVRQVDSQSYLVQLFSWMDGLPTNLQKYGTDLLTSKQCRLYSDADQWRELADRQSERDAARFRYQLEQERIKKCVPA